MSSISNLPASEGDREIERDPEMNREKREGGKLQRVRLRSRLRVITVRNI